VPYWAAKACSYNLKKNKNEWHIYIYINKKGETTVQDTPTEPSKDGPKRTPGRPRLKGEPGKRSQGKHQKQHKNKTIKRKKTPEKWNQKATTKSNTCQNKERRAKEHHGSWPRGEESENPHTNQGTPPLEHPTDANTGRATPPTRDKCKN